MELPTLISLVKVAIIAIIVIAIVDIVWWYSCQKWPPSPVRFPLLGTPFHFLSINYKSMKDMSTKYGGVYSLHVFNTHFVILNDWNIMKEALIVKAEVFSKRPEMLLTHAVLGVEDILFIDGPVWREKRRFTIHHLRNFGVGKTIIEDAIMVEINKVIEILRQHGERKQVMINDLFFSPVLNVLWQIIGGKTFDYDDEEIKQFADVFKEMFGRIWETMPVNFFPILQLLPFDFFNVKRLYMCSNKIIDTISNVIDEHSKTLQLDEPRDYIDAYLAEIQRKSGSLKNGDECYQKSHLIGAINDIFQAGVETTSTTLEWAFLYMAVWPEIQTKVQDELDRVVGRNRQPIYSDHLELPYTRATIMEIQRYSTVIPLCSPRIAGITTQLDGYTIEKGAIIIQNIWAVHRDKAYWDDPEIFRPSRFIDEYGQLKKFENFIPFSTGPRICLGESLARTELFLFITCLLHRFSFRCPTGQPLPSLVPLQTLTLHPKTFNLTIKQRQ